MEETIQALLGTVTDPYLGVSLADAKIPIEVSARPDGPGYRIRLLYGFPIEGLTVPLTDSLEHRVRTVVPNTVPIEWQLESKIHAKAVSSSTKRMPSIKNMVGVMSGKGGVGKSTVAVHLACALEQLGASVGLLDADIYGPSLPTMMGLLTESPELVSEKKFLPMQAHGIACMSIGSLVEPEQALIWRGPMATRALRQLLEDTVWPDLDYLIVDLPPGTGDIPLSLASQHPMSGVVVVTTPQQLALADVRRAVHLLQKTQTPTLGVVENMVAHVCSHCGHQEPLFGSGGGRVLSDAYHCPILARLPMYHGVVNAGDTGRPAVLHDPEVRSHAIELARGLTARLSLRPNDYSCNFPKVVVE